MCAATLEKQFFMIQRTKILVFCYAKYLTEKSLLKGCITSLELVFTTPTALGVLAN